ncbi:hypothetical protein [Roseibium sp.]|uniref:hypothetical protein n=1 Tax=Roseibium sp. TaxID=1936156 RepID=UPI00391C5508
MNETSRFPSTIIVIEDTALAELRTNRELSPSYSDNGIVLLSPEQTRKRGLIDHLDSQGLLTPGTALIQSPYKRGVYARLDEAVPKFSVERATIFSLFCALLGAKSVQFDKLSLITSDSYCEADLSLGTQVLSIDSTNKLKLSRRDFRNIASKLSIIDKYNPEFRNIEKARDLIIDRRLTSDPVMSSMLEAAQIGCSMSSRRAQINLSQETRISQKAVIRLGLSALLSSLNISLKALVSDEEDYEYITEVKVDF